MDGSRPVWLGVVAVFLCFTANPARGQSLSSEPKAVPIAGLLWATTNLAVDRFRNGDPIPEVKDEAEWERAGNEKKPAWCHFRNDPTQGRLYNWWAVSDPRGLAPKGWRVPTNADWKALLDENGGPDDGGALRMPVGRSWKALGLSAGGMRQGYRLGFTSPDYACLWSSTEEDSSSAWAVTISEVGRVTRGGRQRGTGFSVRCVAEAGARPVLADVPPAPPRSAKPAPTPTTPPVVREPPKPAPPKYTLNWRNPHVTDKYWSSLMREPWKSMVGEYRGNKCKCTVDRPTRAKDGSQEVDILCAANYQAGVYNARSSSGTFFVTSSIPTDYGACEMFWLEGKVRHEEGDAKVVVVFCRGKTTLMSNKPMCGDKVGLPKTR